MIIETFQPKETYQCGFEIGQNARAGEVYALIGDLGVGKTVFTQGVAAGLGITEPVNSPTFTILQVYDEGRLPFYHFDGEGVSFVEWADLIRDIMPDETRWVTIEKDLEKGFDYRKITITDPSDKKKTAGEK